MLYEVKSIGLGVSVNTAFDYLGDITNLPEWTHAFAEVNVNGAAVMRTPEGEVPVQVENIVNRAGGLIDTKMVFPDGSTAIAYSRLVTLDDASCAYTFVLTPPPVALEKLEGALAEQTKILEKELQTLKSILER